MACKNFLNIGDKVLMKDGSVLTVRALEYREFCAKERSEYVPKKDIVKILQQEQNEPANSDEVSR
jgi:hypothetical protein